MVMSLQQVNHQEKANTMIGKRYNTLVIIMCSRSGLGSIPYNGFMKPIRKHCGYVYLHDILWKGLVFLWERSGI